MPQYSIFFQQVEKLGFCKGQDTKVYVNTATDVPTEEPSWHEIAFRRKDDT